MKRTETNYKPDQDLEGVHATDIASNTIESRMIAPSEVAEVLEVEILADASAGVDIFTVPAGSKYRIADVIVKGRATSGGGTVIVRRNDTAAIVAIAAAVVDAVARAASIVEAEEVLEAGDVVSLITNGAADRARVTILVIKQV